MPGKSHDVGMNTKRVPNDTQLLDTNDVAALVGNCPRTVMKWRGQPGQGPAFVRISPKMIRYRRSDVDAFIAARVVPAGAKP